MIHIIQNKQDLEEKLAAAGDKLVVIDFYATWCGPCKFISGKLEQLAEQYSEKAIVLKVDVDDNEEITIKYNVTSMPTFVFIKNGIVLDILVGSDPEKLINNMAKYVSTTIKQPTAKGSPKEPANAKPPKIKAAAAATGTGATAEAKPAIK